MELLNRWTGYRIKKAIYRFKKLIPQQDWEHILSLLGRIVFTKDKSETAEAGAGVLENGEYCVVFFLRYLWYRSTDYLVTTVAPEFAHVFLEHDSKGGLSDEEAELAVENQVRDWGIVKEYLRISFPPKAKPSFILSICSIND